MNRENISDFINASVCHIHSNDSRNRTVFLILDNSPKNRTSSISRIAENNRVRIVYTTPTTPQHNFAESIFCCLKRRMTQKFMKSKYVN